MTSRAKHTKIVTKNLLFLNFLVLKVCERLPNPLGKPFIECEKMAALPDVIFTIGNKSFSLSPEQVWVLLAFCAFTFFAYMAISWIVILASNNDQIEVE